MFNLLLVDTRRRRRVDTAENYKVQTGGSKLNKYRIKETKVIQISDENDDLHIFGHLRPNVQRREKRKKGKQTNFPENLPRRTKLQSTWH